MHFFSLAHPPHHYSQTAWQTSWWKFQPGIRVFKRWREKSAKLSKSGQFSSPKARNYVRFVRACVRVVRPGTGRVFRCVFFQWVVRPAFSFAIASEVEKNPFFRAFSFLRFRSLFIFADHRRKLAYCGGWWGDEGWPLPEQPFRSDQLSNFGRRRREVAKSGFESSHETIFLFAQAVVGRSKWKAKKEDRCGRWTLIQSGGSGGKARKNLLTCPRSYEPLLARSFLKEIERGQTWRRRRRKIESVFFFSILGDFASSFQQGQPMRAWKEEFWFWTQYVKRIVLFFRGVL